MTPCDGSQKRSDSVWRSVTHTALYLMPWSSDYTGEDGSWSVVAGETGLAHSRTIVNDQSGNFFVAHFLSFDETQLTTVPLHTVEKT
uniref:Uncharacterized protein n=1 Tax=Romanomermis culicivorax TaxID=13658 RepID=A0A915JUL3_ROMCU